MLDASCRKFSQLSKSEKNENLSKIDKDIALQMVICSAMSYFFGPLCIAEQPNC